MKKLFLTLSLVATLVFTGCDNDNSVNPQPMGKATITGIVYADFDETDDTDNEDVVANTKLVVTLDDDNGHVRYTEVTTDASGKYTIEVDLGNQGLYVYIQPVDFRADVKTTGDTENRIFYGDNFNYANIYVEKGSSLIRDLKYPL
jgi:hypothetical protein